MNQEIKKNHVFLEERKELWDGGGRKNLDGLGLVGGEGGLGEGVIIDEHGLLRQQLLKRLKVPAHLR